VFDLGRDSHSGGDVRVLARDCDGDAPGPRPYRQDRRDRLIAAAFSGKSVRASAAQYSVGVATAIVWVRRARESGDRSARKQGGTKRCKPDPHREYLLALIGETPDLTISELLERLAMERSVTVSRSILWECLARCGLTFKKDRARGRAGPPRRR
jgi:transposase